MHTVLYVDDEPDLLEISKVFLEKSGEYRVETRVSAKDGLVFLENQKIDAIISDYQMPLMDGIGFLKEVRKRYGNDIPFILFTGRGREEVVIEAINNGADFYLQKGGDLNAQFAELSHKIHQSIRRREAEHSLHDSERQLADIIDFLPDATFAINKEGKVIAWNRALEEMTGVPARDMLGKGDFEYSLPPYGTRRPMLLDMIDEPEEKIREYYTYISRDGNSLTAETDLPHPRGTPLTVLIKACNLYNQEGQIVGAIESIRDISERKRAEEELLFKNIILTTQQNTSPDGILIVDEVGKILNYNQKFAEIWGVPEKMLEPLWDEPVLKSVMGQLEDPEAFLSRVKYLYDHKEERSYEELSLKDGRVIERFSSPILAANGKYYGRIWYFRDITGRIRAAREVRESETRFHELFDNMIEGVAIHRLLYSPDGTPLDYRILNANPSLERHLGISRSDVVGKTSREAYGVSDPPYLDTYARVVQTGKPEAFETYFPPMDKYFAISVYRPEDGCFATIFEDISARKKTEIALRDSESRLRSFIEATEESVVLIDEEGNILEWNTGSEKIYGISREEALGKSVADLTFRLLPRDQRTEERKEEIDRMFRSLLATGTSDVQEHRILESERPDGSRVFTRQVVFPIRTEKGFRIGSIGQDITDEKRAADALRESEDRYHLLVQAIDDVVYMIDVEGNVIHISSRVSRYGYTPEDIITHNFREFVANEDLDRVFTGLTIALESTKPILTEFRIRDTSGEYHWVEDNGGPVFDSSGAIIGISGVIRDISERKQTEAALKESEEKFRAFVEFSLDGVLIIDFSGILRFINPAASRIIEADDPQEIIGTMDIMDHIAPESRQAVREDLLRVSQGTDAYLVRYKVITKKGREIWVECVGKKIPYQGSYAMLLSMRDVTEQKLAEEALRRSELQLACAIEGSEAGLWDWEVQTGKVTFNERWAEMIGYTLADLAPLSIDTWLRLCHPDDLRLSEQLLQKHFSHETDLYELEARLRHKDGHWVWVLDRGKVAEWDKDGRPVRMTGTHIDISRRKIVEDALQKANRQLSLLTSVTRHDILNKIMILRGLLTILEKKFQDPFLSDYIQKMTAAVLAINSQIEFTRTYQDLGVHEPQWIVLEKVMPFSQVPEKVAFQCDVLGISVFADPLLERVFFNLLDNSVRHGEGVTEVRVSYQETNENLQILWEDNGVGIADGEKEKIFERGYGKNTGLGMFLAREILALTGIRIRETGTFGKGARFEILAPKGTYRIDR